MSSIALHFFLGLVFLFGIFAIALPLIQYDMLLVSLLGCFILIPCILGFFSSISFLLWDNFLKTKK